MKKMFFTAVALVAFSATSMANTIEVKEVVIPVEEKEEVVIKRTACDVLWIAIYQNYIDTHPGTAGTAGTNYTDSAIVQFGC